MDKREIKESMAIINEYAVLFGYSVEVRNPKAPMYQLAKIVGDGFIMIAYPHKTSAGNHHIRLRDQGSKDKQAYEKAVYSFYNR